MTNHRRFVPIVAAVAAVGLLAGCGTGDTSSSADGKVSLEYWLWDANQQPAYEACAAAFTEANPDIEVEVSQYGWDDYWSQITTGLVGGTAPDVFTGHASYFPTFVDKKQILPIDDAVEEAGIDVDQYGKDLADAWVGADGERYGLPKDIGVGAMYVNSEMLAAAGVDPAELNTLEWNPEDGGSFEALIARLTVDENGVRGDEAGFDKTKVATYGLGLNGGGGALGETIWGQYAVSNGWYFFDEEDGQPHFRFDDPKFLAALDWFQGLTDKGFMPTLEIATSGIGQQDSYGAGKYAMISEGSWSASTLFGFADVTSIVAPLPIGPDGHRSSSANGLGDNVAATTKHPEEAKEFVAFLGSEECQSLVAEKAVVFPAISSLDDATAEAYATAGIDVQPLLDTIADGDIYPSPMVPKWTEVDAMMKPAMEEFLRTGDENVLIEANTQINALYN